jgi:hypothetical protein
VPPPGETADHPDWRNAMWYYIPKWMPGVLVVVASILVYTFPTSSGAINACMRGACVGLFIGLIARIINERTKKREGHIT